MGDNTEPLGGKLGMTPDHDITPARGTSRRVRDGQPADLTRVTDYPVQAVCLECGREIRCDRWVLAEWHHAETDDTRT